MDAKGILEFTKTIAANNNREWYHANKQLYYDAKQQLTNIVSEIQPQLAKKDKSIAHIQPEDTVFRIFRDVRFAKDKSPYKTNMGAFISEGGRKSLKPGYYVHIEPGKSFAGGGVYMPPSPALKNIRSEIYYNSEEFLKLINSKPYTKYFDGLSEMGDKLKTAPKGFPKDWEHIDILRHKHFVCAHHLSDEQVMADNFSEYLLDVFNAMVDFNTFLNRNIDG